MAWKIPLFKIYWDEEDVKSVAEAIKVGMNWAVGPNVEKFEKMIAKYIGAKYCVVFNSGTSALHAALLAHGIKNGDEVIVPSFTFIATANAPLFVGAKPVFADIEEETFGLDPEDVKEKITEKTRAIIPIHYGGCACKIKELREIALRILDSLWDDYLAEENRDGILKHGCYHRPEGIGVDESFVRGRLLFCKGFNKTKGEKVTCQN